MVSNEILLFIHVCVQTLSFRMPTETEQDTALTIGDGNTSSEILPIDNNPNHQSGCVGTKALMTKKRELDAAKKKQEDTRKARANKIQRIQTFYMACMESPHQCICPKTNDQTTEACYMKLYKRCSHCGTVQKSACTKQKCKAAGATGGAAAAATATDESVDQSPQPSVEQ
eukprot:m.8280 g.8280  ORF g.8280 m.8280 type:complete len:171 (-) comp6203_c0_seq1:72-584(-)